MGSSRLGARRVNIAQNILRSRAGAALLAGAAVGTLAAIGGAAAQDRAALLKTLLGEIKPDAGDVLLDGQSVMGWPTHRIAQAGVALANQVPRPFLRLTVEQNVHVGSLSTGDRMRDLDVLELTGLAGKAKRPAGSLGLLDLKRLEMARALSLFMTMGCASGNAAKAGGRSKSDTRAPACSSRSRVPSVDCRMQRASEPDRGDSAVDSLRP